MTSLTFVDITGFKTVAACTIGTFSLCFVWLYEGECISMQSNRYRLFKSGNIHTYHIVHTLLRSPYFQDVDPI